MFHCLLCVTHCIFFLNWYTEFIIYTWYHAYFILAEDFEEAGNGNGVTGEAPHDDEMEVDAAQFEDADSDIDN